MQRHEIPQDQLDRIGELLAGRHGGVAWGNRLFTNAVSDFPKTGIPWRVVPERFGK